MVNLALGIPFLCFFISSDVNQPDTRHHNAHDGQDWCLKSSRRREDSPSTSAKETPTLTVLFQSEHIAVIEKPPLVPCHYLEKQTNRRTKILRKDSSNGNSDDPDAEEVIPVLQRAYATFPNKEDGSIRLVHRLDAATSGCLMLAFSAEAAKEAQDALTNHAQKTYYALCRGNGEFLRQQGVITADGPVKDSKGKMRDAVTVIEGLCGSDGPPQRCCLVRASPRTGRWHQIRQHLGRLNHPIVSETRHHPDRKENKAWKIHFEDLGYRQRLCLHCHSIRIGPNAGSSSYGDGEQGTIDQYKYLPPDGIHISCPFPADLEAIIQSTSWCDDAKRSFPTLFAQGPGKDVDSTG